MVLPSWVTFLVAIWAIAFGIFRFGLAARLKKHPPTEDDDRPNFRRKGIYARSPRTHIFFGVGYLVLGGFCLAMGLGYNINIVGACMGDKNVGRPDQVEPASDDSPNRGVEVELTH